MNDIDKTVREDSVPPMSSGSQESGHELLQTGMMQPPPNPGLLGTVGRYQVVRLLGEGGMGQVLLAREPVTDSLVAIKMIKAEFVRKDWAVHRFLTEARHMYKMSHPSIIRVLDVSDRPEGPYFVMPFMAGGSLAQKIKPGEPLAADLLPAVARQVADALHYAHTQGIIHRDLKPSNILLDAEGRAYLSDFGLLRTVFNDSIVDVGQQRPEGTVPYMSPAVACGKAEDTRCDIYAFGCLLYELLTGQPPYQGPTIDAILKQIQTGPPQPIRELNPKAPANLVAIADHAMGRELRDRYAAMADVLGDLDRAAQGKAPLGPHGRAAGSPLARNILAAAGVVILIGLSAIGISKLLGIKPVAGIADPGLLPKSPASSPPATAEKPVAATAQDQFTFTTNNGAITITGYIVADATMNIPATINGLPVAGIADQAFKSCAGLTNVMIPASVTLIGKEAFAGCTNLASVHFKGHAPGGGSYSSLFEGGINATVYYAPDTKGWTATYGGRPAFLLADGFACTSTSNAVTIAKYIGPGGNVTIPDAINGLPVTRIGENAFKGCIGLTSVTIPNSVTAIDSSAFQDCSGLTNVTLPNTLLSLGVGAFSHCARLNSMTLPNTVTSVGDEAFHTCHNLIRVMIPASVTHGVGAVPWLRKPGRHRG